VVNAHCPATKAHTVSPSLAAPARAQPALPREAGFAPP
jgi:hypothetical protein